jgi:hypothetical protein
MFIEASLAFHGKSFSEVDEFDTPLFPVGFSLIQYRHAAIDLQIDSQRRINVLTLLVLMGKPIVFIATMSLGESKWRVRLRYNRSMDFEFKF